MLLRKPIAVEGFINAVKKQGAVLLGPDLFILNANLFALARLFLGPLGESVATPNDDSAIFRYHMRYREILIKNIFKIDVICYICFITLFRYMV